MSFKAFPILTIVALALSGCTSMSVFRDNESPAKPAIAEAPVEPETAQMAREAAAPPTSAMSAAKIRSVVAGKSFRWVGPNNSGTTIFAQDGKSLIEVDGKGQTSGRWVARDGLLCESIDPGPILPKGAPEKCNPFSASGSRYRVGPATLTPS